MPRGKGRVRREENMKRKWAYAAAACVLVAGGGACGPSGPSTDKTADRGAAERSGESPTVGKRVALVIGNGAYGGEVGRLENPGNDARAIAGKLRGLDFEVLEGVDLGRKEFYSKIKEFSKRSAGAEAALLFYAGHGMQVEGKNYLIPVDAGSLEDKTDMRNDTVELAHVLEEMDGKTNLVFLDACRNNPLERRMRSSSRGGSSGRGLAPVAAKEMGGGVLIAYAAEPGETASDGEGKNSPYTEALLKHIGTPGVSVLDMLAGVVEEVEDATGGGQLPWTYNSLRKPLFRFAPGPVVTAPGDGCDMIRLSWDVVKDTKDEGELGKFITDFEKCPGTGVLVARARNVLAELRKPVVAPQPTRKQPGERFQDCGVCPWMVVLPGGSFLMGSPESEEGRDDDEGPVHGVTIPEAFAVGEYEVTREEYGAYVADTGRSSGGSCYVRAGGKWEDRAGLSWRDPGYAQTRRDPVVCVSWEDAREYVEWLSGKTGKEYRLLSEAEWEYAARAGSRRRYSFGDSISPRQANYRGSPRGRDRRPSFGDSISPRQANYRESGHKRKTVEVGSYGANRFGLYDMHGNAWEWVQDCWNDSYRGAPDDGSAWESGDCARRVSRGGSWNNFPWGLRSAYRGGNNADDRFSDDGFRVGRTLTP